MQDLSFNVERICPSFKLVNRRKSVNFTRWVSGFFQKHRTILRPSKLIVVAPFESSHFFKIAFFGAGAQSQLLQSEDQRRLLLHLE